MLSANAENPHSPSALTEQGGGQPQPSSSVTAGEVLDAIRDLRAVVNPDVRVDMLVRVVVHHAPDDPDVVALALAEVDQARCSPQTRRTALARLQPVKTSLWRRAGTPPMPQVQNDLNLSAPALEVRLDPELGRLAIGLHQAGLLRLWTLGAATCRQNATTGADGSIWPTSGLP